MRRSVSRLPAHPLPLVQELRWRGLLHRHTLQRTDKEQQQRQDTSDAAPNASTLASDLSLQSFIDGRRVKCGVYAGFDPTAQSLHVGNLLSIMVLRHFYRRGYRAVALVGGVTGLIGDPSGRSLERPLLSERDAASNCARITRQIASLMPSMGTQYEEGYAATHGEFHVVNNADWHGATTVADFLRSTGRHFRVGDLLAKDALKTRLQSKQGLSFTELAYPLFQAADFAHLARHPRMTCHLQVGGSDQFGNITAGCSLVRTLNSAGKDSNSYDDVDGDEEEASSSAEAVHGLTTPLLTTSDGAKLGKSSGGGGVWLDPEMTTPLQLYQYFLQRSDDDAVNMLKLLTFVAPPEIVAIEQEHFEKPEKRLAQHRLAAEVVSFVHGDAASHQAQTATAALFTGGSTDASTEDRVRQLLAASQTDKHLKTAMPRAAVLGEKLGKVFVAAGLCKSMREAKDLQSDGGLYVNENVGGEVVTDADLVQVDGVSYVLLRRGKKNHKLVALE